MLDYKNWKEWRSCQRKVRYPKLKQAKTAANINATKYGCEPLNAYKCHYCGGWHLTSQ